MGHNSSVSSIHHLGSGEGQCTVAGIQSGTHLSPHPANMQTLESHNPLEIPLSKTLVPLKCLTSPQQYHTVTTLQLTAMIGLSGNHRKNGIIEKMSGDHGPNLRGAPGSKEPDNAVTQKERENGSKPGLARAPAPTCVFCGSGGLGGPGDPNDPGEVNFPLSGYFTVEVSTQDCL